MRKLLAVVLSLSLQAATVGAPLVHSHPDERVTDHHDGRGAHVHWAAHGSSDHHIPDGPSLEAADHDRAVYVNAFIAVATPPITLSGVAEQIFALPVSTERAAHRRIDDVRAHDPPASWSVSPRAPPLRLS